VLRRVFEQGAYADRAFTAEAKGLSARDRALAMQLAYGAVQRRATLDHVAAALADRRADSLDPPVLAAVRLGLYQVLFLRGVAEHAAVNESVELAKQFSRGGATLVNAILRRAARERDELLAALDDRTPEHAAICHSVPLWLAEQWFAELGPDPSRALLRAINEPAESALRANSLVITREQALARLPVPAHPAQLLPEAIVLDAPFDAHGSELWHQGAITPQSRGSTLVARVLAPEADQRVLDLCAAPGAKTTHLAALMGDRGELVAVERHPGRARALAASCARMHVTCVEVHAGDATAFATEPRFHRVLVDPPCSGLGTLQSRPDVRWRASPQAIEELAALQGRILAAGAAATAPGGTLAYSVCTISCAEGRDVIDRFLSEHPEFTADRLGAELPELADPRDPRFLQLTPDRHRTDGFFIARMRRG
jgi:16S rRNA (cytosine967-C5)-methyltransferase